MRPSKPRSPGDMVIDSFVHIGAVYIDLTPSVWLCFYPLELTYHVEVAKT